MNHKGVLVLLKAGSQMRCTSHSLSGIFNTAADKNPDDVKVIKVAPTGKAVCNINGNTFILSFKYQQIEGKNTALLIVID